MVAACEMSYQHLWSAWWGEAATSLGQSKREKERKKNSVCSISSAQTACKVVAEKRHHQLQRGMLGCGFKVAPAKNNPEHIVICCIYVSDFSNRFEVLNKVVVSSQMMLGIESKNEWRLEPTIYSVKEMNEWPDNVEPEAMYC